MLGFALTDNPGKANPDALLALVIHLAYSRPVVVSSISIYLLNTHV